MQKVENENLAQTLARELPTPVDFVVDPGGVTHVGLPPGWSVSAIDDEKILNSPRRAKGSAVLDDAVSFVDFVGRYARPGTTVWCQFDPSKLALSFRCVINEHDSGGLPGWRDHLGVFTPRVSEEWKVWTYNNGSGQPKRQADFAQFIEDHEPDLASVDGMPTSSDMMRMALDFEAKAELKIKSRISLQTGGTALEFINEADGATTEKMRLFERFSIGIPVFWRAPKDASEKVAAYLLTARLRFRLSNPPIFWYELVRPDLVHQRAALELIAEIRAGIGQVPLVMGNAT